MPAEFTGAHVPFPEGWVAGDPGGTWLPERVCEVANGESRLVQPIPPSIAVPGPLQLQSSKNWVTSPSVKRIFMASQSLSQVFEHPKKNLMGLYGKK